MSPLFETIYAVVVLIIPFRGRKLLDRFSMREQFPFCKLKSVVYSVGEIYGTVAESPCSNCTPRRILGKIIPLRQHKRRGSSWPIGVPRNRISSHPAFATRPVRKGGALAYKDVPLPTIMMPCTAKCLLHTVQGWSMATPGSVLTPTRRRRPQTSAFWSFLRIYSFRFVVSDLAS